jgi:dGTPase
LVARAQASCGKVVTSALARQAGALGDQTTARAEGRTDDYAEIMANLAGRVADSFELITREREEAFLSPLAVRSYETRGRERPDEPCRLRTPFQRDRDRIVHSKSFRRLKHKTQVFIDPPDHYRTRLTHTLETTAISRTVARALRLNEDLAEAIGLGHDVGHPPFGHAGEEALDEALRRRFGRRFRHNEHSLRVVDVVEREGRGLNLTAEVRDGILRHTGSEEASTLEGRIVRLVDRVAYINHDIDDAIRHGALAADELPSAEIELLGPSGARRIDRLVHDLVETSEQHGDIRQSREIGEAMLALRRFMFERVYLGDEAQAQHRRAREIVLAIFDDLAAHPERLPEREDDIADRITDHVAGMTDRFALAYADGL